jgi:hypothetical protein
VIDVGLSAMQLILVIFAEHAKRSDAHDRKPEPGAADRGTGHELLSEEALAEPSVAIETGDGAPRDPIRHQPPALRHGLVLQRDRVQVA